MSNAMFDWTCVYRTDNPLEAHIVLGLLAQARLKTHVEGEALAAALGEMPFAHNTIKIFVCAIKVPEAEEILVNYQQTNLSEDWQCSSCSEHNGSGFQYCWHCGKSYDEGK
ncbi:DUF2007 domain-containing protein [Pseudoalteromonas ardens]|uniref:RanBP2-type domain-containing protein n=1 Tax=Pseudoalteromonas rubra TaxID=43658 RepID=A0A0L0EUJ1_9GAMM|nr:DUF2007 domain-containing protein [Pseudoalteromonas sp. R96]KNC68069.1 hypothetical protein AC626_07045 [Pseudoalteromonas rubra]MDK1312167.1 DUF2007 domain-containing protein [Pseudoalteromonas sp. R96]